MFCQKTVGGFCRTASLAAGGARLALPPEAPEGGKKASICKGYETAIHSKEMVNCNKKKIKLKAFYCIYFGGFGHLPDNKFILALEILSNRAI